MKIEDRVRLAFDLGLNKEFLPMLSFALPAVEASAKKSGGVGGKAEFLKFIRKNYDILEWFSGKSIDYSRMRFPTIDPQYTANKSVPSPDLAEILYHLYRCALAHGQDIAESFAISPTRPDGLVSFHISGNGKIFKLPESIAWGIIAAIVLDPANEDLQSRSGNYFTLMFEQNTYYINVDLFWGQKVRLETISLKYSRPPDQTDAIMLYLSNCLKP